ncbi:hypothetical protein C8J57DRAFT_1245447 [Mycena rebaudengoi]|nr:hypothetical protein C8J57DRAFT_1245447 [Mycena rebaudengoi]
MPAIRKKEKVQANTLDSFLNITVRTHPAKKTSESLLHLNLQQKNVYQRVLNGESIFFTGSAGTGKSLLLREVIGGLRKKWENAGAVAVTASTGIAACNINVLWASWWLYALEKAGWLYTSESRAYSHQLARRTKPKINRRTGQSQL